MASDLPDARHRDSRAMARVLVTYMSCPRAIRSAIREDFQQSPAIQTIERYRAEHLAGLRKPADPPFKAFEGYRHDEVSRNAEYANKRFLAALARERAA